MNIKSELLKEEQKLRRNHFIIWSLRVALTFFAAVNILGAVWWLWYSIDTIFTSDGFELTLVLLPVAGLLTIGLLSIAVALLVQVFEKKQEHNVTLASMFNAYVTRYVEPVWMNMCNLAFSHTSSLKAHDEAWDLLAQDEAVREEAEVLRSMLNPKDLAEVLALLKARQIKMQTSYDEILVQMDEVGAQIQELDEHIADGNALKAEMQRVYAEAIAFLEEMDVNPNVVPMEHRTPGE